MIITIPAAIRKGPTVIGPSRPTRSASAPVNAHQEPHLDQAEPQMEKVQGREANHQAVRKLVHQSTQAYRQHAAAVQAHLGGQAKEIPSRLQGG